MYRLTLLSAASFINRRANDSGSMDNPTTKGQVMGRRFLHLHDEAFRALLGLAEAADDPALRRMAIFCLRDLAPQDPAAAQVLIAATREPDLHLRRAAFNKLGIFACFNKTKVLAFAARNDRQAVVVGPFFHFRLGPSAERKGDARELLLREAMEKIGLIFFRVDGAQEMKLSVAFFDLCVVTGDEDVAVELSGAIEQEAEFDELVAREARRRSNPCGVSLDKGRHHMLLKTILRIHDVVTDAERGAYFLRAGDMAVWDRETGAATRWSRLRPDCWISTIPASGMLLSPEGGGGCSCGSWIQASMGFTPRDAQ